MDIAVLGVGYVGIVTAICLSEQGHSVSCYDIDPERVNQYQQGVCPFYEEGVNEWVAENRGKVLFSGDLHKVVCDAQVVFLCVGTPQKESGEANLSYLRAALEGSVDCLKNDAVVVIKSTVPPETTKQMEEFARGIAEGEKVLHFAMVPEFLAQGTALKDGRKPSRIVIGASDSFAGSVLQELFKGYDCPVILTDPTSAELTKYASNSFLATKVSFINEMARLCEAAGGSIEDVSRGMGADPRIGKAFLKASVGYGGSCFPKDTRALSFYADAHEISIPVVNGCIQSNEEQIKSLLHKATGTFGSFEGLTVAILGLSFKAGTGDMRCSPAIPYIKYLRDQGALVRGYDPYAKVLDWLSGYIEVASPLDAVREADCCFILTDDPTIVSSGLKSLVDAMRQKYIFDGRNCFSLEEAKQADCFYTSIGRTIIKPKN